MNNLDIAVNYCNDVLSNVIPACIYVKQACQRFLNDLQNPDYYYNSNEVDTIIKFINQLNLTEQAKPTKFLLQNWQTFIICNLYGLYNKSNDEKKYRAAYIELARKQGKSQLITALAVYHLILDTDSQIVLSANSREQIKQVDYKKIRQFALQLDPKQKHIKLLYNKATFQTNELITTASDASRLDGLNASFVLIDELHEAKDNKVYNVLKSSQGARTNPLFVVITTAGFNTESFCYSLRTYCTSILSGEKIDESQFTIIYTLDENDNFGDENIWIKANPNLNVSLNKGFLAGEVNKAINNNIEKSGVLVKNFNIWQKVNAIDNWIDDKYIINAMQDIDINEERFKNIEIFAGVDLASVSDIAAVAYCLQLDDKLYFFTDYYINSESHLQSANSEIYKEAANLNQLNVTAGNVIDYDYILKDILIKNKNNFIIQLAYDKWNSTQFAINATDSGLNLIPFSQMPGNLNKPLKEFERLIKSGNIVLQNNILTKWMFNNVILKVNQMGNYSIDKSNSNKKIDGVAAIINALGIYLENPKSSGFAV